MGKKKQKMRPKNGVAKFMSTPGNFGHRWQPQITKVNSKNACRVKNKKELLQGQD